MNIPYAVRREQYEEALQRTKAANAALASWQEAFGLLTTLTPDLEVNINDPLGMARAIERHVLAERAALAAANARAEAAETKLATVPWDAISLVVRMLDDGQYDQAVVDEVNRWLDTRPGLAEQRDHDIDAHINELKQQSEVQP